MPSDKELRYLKQIEKLKQQIKADKSKVGFGNTPGERKAITGKAEKIKPKSQRGDTKPLRPLRPLTRLEMEKRKLDRPFKQRPKKPKR